MVPQNNETYCYQISVTTHPFFRQESHKFLCPMGNILKGRESGLSTFIQAWVYTARSVYVDTNKQRSMRRLYDRPLNP